MFPLLIAHGHRGIQKQHREAQSECTTTHSLQSVLRILHLDSLRTGLGKTDAHCPGRIDQYLLIEEYRPVVAEYAGGCRRRIQKEVFFHIAAADREVLAVRGDYPEVGPAAGRFGVRPVYPFSGRDNKGIVCE